MLPLFAYCHQPHTAHKQWLSPAHCCQPHVTIAHMHHHQPHGAHERFLSPVYHRQLCITIIHMSLLATWCPQAVPITYTSLLPAHHHSHHHRPHGTPKQCPLPMCCCRPCVTIACMSLSAAWCPQAVPVTCILLLPACHRSCRHQLHGAPKRCLLPMCCCQLHVTIAYMSPLATWCT